MAFIDGFTVLTYMERGMRTYENRSPTTQKATIEVQLGRTSHAVNEPRLLIERWSGKIEPYTP